MSLTAGVRCNDVLWVLQKHHRHNHEPHFLPSNIQSGLLESLLLLAVGERISMVTEIVTELSESDHDHRTAGH